MRPISFQNTERHTKQVENIHSRQHRYPMLGIFQSYELSNEVLIPQWIWWGRTMLRAPPSHRRMTLRRANEGRPLAEHPGDERKFLDSPGDSADKSSRWQNLQYEFDRTNLRGNRTWRLVWDLPYELHADQNSEANHPRAPRNQQLRRNLRCARSDNEVSEVRCRGQHIGQAMNFGVSRIKKRAPIGRDSWRK